MNEIERMLLLPIRLKPSLNGPLKDTLHAMMSQARMAPEVLGMIQAVGNGYLYWVSFVQGMDTDMPQTHGAYVRSVAITIPDLFVLSWDRRSFGKYQLDENEQKVLDSSREDLDAKLSVIATSSRELGEKLDAQARDKVSLLLKEDPRFNRPAARGPQIVRR